MSRRPRDGRTGGSGCCPLTPEGLALERRLFEQQRERLAAAFREAGGPAVEGFGRVMRAVMGPSAPGLPGSAGPRMSQQAHVLVVDDDDRLRAVATTLPVGERLPRGLWRKPQPTPRQDAFGAAGSSGAGCEHAGAKLAWT